MPSSYPRSSYWAPKTPNGRIQYGDSTLTDRLTDWLTDWVGELVWVWVSTLQGLRRFSSSPFVPTSKFAEKWEKEWKREKKKCVWMGKSAFAAFAHSLSLSLSPPLLSPSREKSRISPFLTVRSMYHKSLVRFFRYPTLVSKSSSTSRNPKSHESWADRLCVWQRTFAVKLSASIFKSMFRPMNAQKCYDLWTRSCLK